MEGLLNRLHIAQPKRVDPNRVPCIPESILKKRQVAAEKAERKRKLEREIEEEMGDDYVLDLKKNYDIEGDQKYDVIPEMWEGRNIADYIDPDIFEVSANAILFNSLRLCHDKTCFYIVLRFSETESTGKGRAIEGRGRLLRLQDARVVGDDARDRTTSETDSREEVRHEGRGANNESFHEAGYPAYSHG